MAFTLKYNESTLAKNLDALAERIGATVLLYAGTKASIIEGEMKAGKGTPHLMLPRYVKGQGLTLKIGRPWVDQSGAAKARLNASVTMPNSETVRITLAHGVDYGIWLELANEKKYAIIAPTVKRVSPEIVEDLNGIMGKVK